jgi:hypothetical protein
MITDEKVEPDPWLSRVGYEKHLMGYGLTDLLCLPNKAVENEMGLLRLIDRFTKSINASIDYSQTIDRNHCALFEVKRIDVNYPTKPFNPNLERPSWSKYIGFFVKIITVIYRMESEEFIKTSYRFTGEQQILWRALNADTHDEIDDSFYIDFLLSLVTQRIMDDSYECVILSTLSIIMLRSDR